MEFTFLKERLDRFLAIIPESYKIADEIKKSPKGLSVVIERDPSKKAVPGKPAALGSEAAGAQKTHSVESAAKGTNPKKEHENE